MKKTLLLITLFITGVCFGQKYELAEEFYDNGLPKVINTYKVSKDKIELVKEIKWYENGQKKRELAFKDGEFDGKRTEWYENGQKNWEETYKDGKSFVSNSWDENGKIMVKDGNGLFTEWYENGQKWIEITYKDGKEEGLQTYWYENGQKRHEGTVKDGELIESTHWDEDGNKL